MLVGPNTNINTLLTPNHVTTHPPVATLATHMCPINYLEVSCHNTPDNTAYLRLITDSGQKLITCNTYPCRHTHLDTHRHSTVEGRSAVSGMAFTWVGGV